MTPSVAQRAACSPMPPQIKTAFAPFSKNLNRLPSCSRSTARQFLTSCETSRCMAATNATLTGIAVLLKPVHCALQGGIDRNCIPSQISFGLGRSHEHLLPSHADGVNRCSRLTAQQASSHHLVHDTSRQRHDVRHLHFRRRQTCNIRQLIENLFQSKI